MHRGDRNIGYYENVYKYTFNKYNMYNVNKKKPYDVIIMYSILIRSTPKEPLMHIIILQYGRIGKKPIKTCGVHSIDFDSR